MSVASSSLRTLAAVIAVLLIATGLTFVIAQDDAEAAWSDCPSGYLCLFSKSGYGNPLVLKTSTDSTLVDDGFNDRTSSVRNRHSKAFRLYADVGPSGPYRCYASNGSQYNLSDVSFNDRTSAVYRLTGSSC